MYSIYPKVTGAYLRLELIFFISQSAANQRSKPWQCKLITPRALTMLRILSMLLCYIGILFRPIANGSTWVIRADRKRLMTVKSDEEAEEEDTQYRVQYLYRKRVQYSTHITWPLSVGAPHTNFPPGRDATIHHSHIHKPIRVRAFTFTREATRMQLMLPRSQAVPPSAVIICTRGKI